MNSLRRFEEALRPLEIAMDIDPNHFNTWFSIGLSLFSLEKYEDSIEFFDKTVELNPDIIIASYIKCKALLKIPGRDQEAQKCLKRFIKTAPAAYEPMKRAARQLVTGKYLPPKIQIQGTDKRSKKFIITTEEEGIKLHGKGFYTGLNKGTTFIRYNDITSIAFNKGLVMGDIEISVPGNKIKVRNVNPVDGPLFTNTVSEIIQNLKSENKSSKNVQIEKISPMDEIKKAKDLLDIGAITEEDFNEIKRKYLNQI